MMSILPKAHTEREVRGDVMTTSIITGTSYSITDIYPPYHIDHDQYYVARLSLSGVLHDQVHARCRALPLISRP